MTRMGLAGHRPSDGPGGTARVRDGGPAQINGGQECQHDEP